VASNTGVMERPETPVEPTDGENEPADDADSAVRPDAIDQRAHLSADEAAAGSDDPRRQAEVILEESAERVESGGERSAAVERRTSADTVPPPDLV
jgi:hypothetical protein